MHDLNAFEARLGFQFADASLLTQALTHSSALDLAPQGGSNQRLEFMGDRVLGLVVSEALLDRHPKAEEGELALLFNALVRKETCAEVAKQLGLGGYLALGPGEEKAGGREKPAILADACEALIAAIYLDGGLEVARDFILQAWQPMFASPPKPGRDAKTALQEWAQSHGLGLPVYRVKGRTGVDHAPLFTVEVEVHGMEPLQGSASSKRQAEQEAAAALLAREGQKFG